MIHVIATITTNPGQREAVLKLLRVNTPKVLAEPGCIQYDTAIDLSGAGAFQTEVGPDSFVCIEKWESIDALKAHIAAPHMVVYATETKPLVARRIIQVLDPIRDVGTNRQRSLEGVIGVAPVLLRHNR